MAWIHWNPWHGAEGIQWLILLLMHLPKIEENLLWSYVKGELKMDTVVRWIVVSCP